MLTDKTHRIGSARVQRRIHCLAQCVLELQPSGFHAFVEAAEGVPNRSGTTTKALSGSDESGEGGDSPHGGDHDDADLLRWYAAALRNESGDAVMGKASGAWSKWEMSIYGLASRLSLKPPRSWTARTTGSSVA